MVNILGTRKQYLLVIFQLALYFSCCWVVFKNDLMRLDNINAWDYYNSEDLDTQIFFTSKEIQNVFNQNFLYVKHYLIPMNNAEYDDIKKNSTVTNFYGVYPNETTVDWKYAKKDPFFDLLNTQ